VYIEQRLSTCEVCSRTLALQYHWPGGRVPSGQDPIVVRRLACPECGHVNPFFTLMYAHRFELKVVPGPTRGARVQPNSVRRLWMRFPLESSKKASRRPRSARRWPFLTTLGRLWRSALISSR